MSKLRILQVVGSLDPSIGGPIEGVLQTSRWLVEGGNQVELLTMDSPGDPLAGALLAACPFPVHAAGRVHLKYAYTPGLLPWLRNNLCRYDSVVVNGIWQYFSLAVWRAARQAEVPYIVFPHGMLDPYFKHAFPWKHRKKWLYWRLAERRVLRDAARVAFTCEQERVLAPRSFGAWCNNSVVVGYGTSGPEVDLAEARNAFLDAHPDLRGRRLALYLGRIHPKKGCDLLIKAFAATMTEDDDWRLVIVGPGESGCRQDLAQMTRDLGVEQKVQWTGMLLGTEKWGAFAAAEVFVLPSHQENFGLAVVEALACGVPVLISRQVNIWKEIRECGAGLCEDDSVAGVESMLRQWALMKAAERLAMRQAAHNCFLQHFEASAAAASLEAVLTTMIRRSPDVAD